VYRERNSRLGRGVGPKVAPKNAFTSDVIKQSLSQ